MKKIVIVIFLCLNASILLSLTNEKKSAESVEAMPEYGDQLPDSVTNYLEQLCDSASYYLEQEEYSTAIGYGETIKSVIENHIGKDCEEYLFNLEQLIEINDSIGNYPEAISYCEELLDIIGRNIGKTNKRYITWLGILSKCYSDQGKYKVALSKGEEALNMYSTLYSKEDSVFFFLKEQYASFIKSAKVDSLMALGEEKLSAGMFMEGRSEIEKAVDVSKIEYGRESLQYANALGMLAYSYCFVRDDLPMAIKYGKKAKKIQEATNHKNHSDYAAILHLLAMAYSHNNQENEALHTGKEALKIQEKIHGKKHQAYASTLNQLGSFYSILDSADQALRMKYEAFKIREALLQESGMKDMKAFLELGNSYNHIATELVKHEEFDDAITCENLSLEIVKNILGKQHPGYASSLERLASFCASAKKYNQMEEYVIESEPIKENLLRNYFVDLAEEQRNNYWNKNGHNRYYRALINRYTYRYPSPKMIECGYNATLFSKGLLLSLSKEMSALIKNSGDKTLITQYDDIKNNHLMLQKLYEMPIAERTINTDSLELVTQKMEHNLMTKSKVYGDYTKNIGIKWKDVQQKLGSNDLAVEFVSFDWKNDSTMYMAYVLQKDMEHPKLVTLFEEKQLHKSQDLYTTSEMSQLVWKPLEKYLNEAKNVYFSPSGELYNIAIESLPHWNDGILMSDKWNMYRLTSTRELALVKDKNDFKHANIYGGVKYDTDEQTLAANSRMFAKSRAMNASSLYQLADTLNMRSGVNYLPSTKEEAIEIDNTLRQKQVKTNLRIESLATESDFRNLDGKNTNLIHVATHGFYWTEREAKYHDDLSFLMIEDYNSHKYVEDKALTRSGLLMAGANNALMGKQLPEGVDDGILTAKEISQLDLRGTDLVVLSACQTGLGEIKGDGVFGLQRGFKKAGVQSILMSLWKVDDDATKLLMTQFYKNLTSGTGKHEALRLAQKYVREYKSKDYQDPYFWAAFVLLDAID